MTDLFEASAAGILTGWCLYRVLGRFLPRNTTLLVAVGVGFMPFFVMPGLAFYALVIAVFAPFGMMLPVLAAQSILRDFGIGSKRFATVDLIVILVLYVGFIAASIGVIDWDPYRYGYAPLWGGAMAVGLCIYGALRGHIGVCIAALGGQILWMMDIGSSNYFDHVSHVMIIPVIATCLIRRGIWAIRNKARTGPATATP